MRKKTLQMILGIGLMATLLTGCKIRGREVVFEFQRPMRNTVFSINDFSCGVQEAKLYLVNYRNLYGTAYGIDLWEGNFKDTSLKEYVKGVTLNELTQIYCMNLIAQQEGISLTETDRSRVKSATEEYFNSLNGEEIEYLQISKEQLQEYYGRYALADKLYRELTQGVNREVSDDDARVIHIKKIFVSEEATAQKVEEKLEAGQDFQTIADSFSEDSNTDCRVARGQLAEGVEEIAFEMERGDVSSRIATEDGFYFIKCVNKFEEKLTEANKKNILKAREKQMFEDVYQGYVERAKFQLNEKVWMELELAELDNLKTDSFFDVFDQ